jgi:hypothetical protein
VPALTPVIIPVSDPAVAVPGAEEVQVPPEVTSLSIIVPPLSQIDAVPDIVETIGAVMILAL